MPQLRVLAENCGKYLFLVDSGHHSHPVGVPTLHPAPGCRPLPRVAPGTAWRLHRNSTYLSAFQKSVDLSCSVKCEMVKTEAVKLTEIITHAAHKFSTSVDSVGQAAHSRVLVQMFHTLRWAPHLLGGITCCLQHREPEQTPGDTTYLLTHWVCFSLLLPFMPRLAQGGDGSSVFIAARRSSQMSVFWKVHSLILIFALGVAVK